MRKKLQIIHSLLLVFILFSEQPQFSENRFILKQQTTPVLDYTYVLNEELNLNSSIPVYRIIYNLNLGENHFLNPSFYYAQTLPLTLYPPAREGYNFAGWYTDSRYKHPVTQIRDCEGGNLILYAKWTRQISSSNNIQLYSYVSGTLTRAPEKKLSNMNYRVLEDLNIPGMPGTRYEDLIAGTIYSADQCPQGMCVSGEYILVTTYSTGSRKCKGCLHVFDKKTGEYLLSLAMRQGSHLGGIAFDGRAVWICHSNYRTIERLDYTLLREVAEQKPQQLIDISGEIEEYKVNNSPSCITCYNGKLWIATHTRFFQSVMKSYSFREETGELEEEAQYAIPDKVQGVAFDSRGHVYLSTSFGRQHSSYIKVYQSIMELGRHPERPKECVEMPPCSEEIAISGNELLVLFESGAQKYMEGTDGKGKGLTPLDHLVAISLASF